MNMMSNYASEMLLLSLCVCLVW